MRICLISLMAYCVLIVTSAVAQQREGDKPVASDAVAAQQPADGAALQGNVPPADSLPAAAAAEKKSDAPDQEVAKPAEPPVAPAVVAEPPAVVVEPPAVVVEPPAVVVEPPKEAAVPVVAAPPVSVEPPVGAVVEPEKVDMPPAKMDVVGVAAGVASNVPPAVGVAVVGEPAKQAAVESPDVAEIKNLQWATRQAQQAHAEAQLQKGEKELKNGKFQDAVRFFEEALDSLERVGDRAGNDVLKQRVFKGLGETYYNWARLLMNERNFEDAKKRARSAGTYWHPKTAEILAEIEKAENKKVDVRPVYPPVRWKQEEYIAKERDIAARMKMGRQYYLTGEYEKSRDVYETVMRLDPENTEAIRMLHKISDVKERTAVMESDMTRQGMIAETRKAWSRRDYADLGELSEMRTNVVGGVRLPPDEVIRQQILSKMEKITLPGVDFKQAHIRDVIEFLGKQSQEYDKDEPVVEKKGVNIVLTLTPAGGAQKPAEPAAPLDPFAAAPAAGENRVGGEEALLITFSAHNISLLESLKIVCNVANLKFRVEGSVVMVMPLDWPEGRIIHRMYDVLPSFLQRMEAIAPSVLQGPGGAPAPAAAAAPAGEDPRADLRATFAKFGIAWPQGSSIQHLPQIGKLIVANTVDNLAIFEKILGVLNVVPAQIEIEAKFVEVRQTDVESLGLEWLLTDNWEVMQRRGSEGLPLDQRQRIQIDAQSTGGGLTRGNRFMSTGAGLPANVGSVNDSIMRVSSVLTNPELSLILHAIQQKGNSDVLSAPKVTTKSASEATIKVVREYIYPTEFTVNPIMGAAAGGINTIVGGVVEPGGFETREVGVILSVMPEVTPDGQMIDITMTPQVVDEPDWENYGSEYTAPDGRVTRLPMRQPIFSARSVTTSLSIYNGSTVVLGGMMNEKRSAVDDKVPLLGDLPFIGRLFRSKYEHSDKRNLLIFVTARMVDPAGRAIIPQDRKLQDVMTGLGTSSISP